MKSVTNQIELVEVKDYIGHQVNRHDFLVDIIQLSLGMKRIKYSSSY